MGLPSIVDTALDRSVVLGYGNVGLAVRRRLPGWPQDPPRMDGKAVLVTGAASGLGLAAAIGFARLGALVWAGGRNAERADDAVRQICAAVPSADVRPLGHDISTRAGAGALLAQLLEQADRLDVLVNNAGVMPDERTRTVDGVELTFATHVLAPWLLIEGLSPLLERNPPGRVINVSSGGQYGQRVPAGDPQSEKDSYSPKKIYARTKREQTIVGDEWAKRLADRGIVVHTMHPGWADTKGVQNWMPVFRAVTRPIIRNPEQGADTVVWLGAAPEPATSTGLFWHDRRSRPKTLPVPGAGPDSPQVRAELIAHVEALAAGKPVASAS
ncbi:MAG: SDR family NAD(P)-dependent oxidoreductase [Sporichthyaceae bacterium]